MNMGEGPKMSLSRVKFDNFGLNAAVSSTRAKILSHHITALFQRYAARLASLAFFVGLWHFASTSRLHLGLVTFANVPAPAEVIDAFIALARSGKLVPHLFSCKFARNNDPLRGDFASNSNPS